MADDDTSLDLAIEQLARGAVVAAATESFFGLLADARDAAAVERLLSLKPRGSDKGVPLILPARSAWAALLAEPVPALADAFADAFWPGGLSIALAAHAALSPRLSLDGSLAVRLPGASAAARVARRFGAALSATSANPPGQPAARLASEVRSYFTRAIESGELLVLDGSAPGGAPSTVVRVTGDQYAVMREGAVRSQELAQVRAALDATQHRR